MASVVHGELVQREAVDAGTSNGPAALVRDALLVIVRQRRVVLGVYVGIVVAALAFLFLTSPQYRATSKVLVTTNRADISTNEEKPTEFLRTGQVGLGELAAQLEIIRSRALIGTTLHKMGVTGAPSAEKGFLATLRSIVSLPADLVTAAYRRLHGLERVDPDQGFDGVLSWAMDVTEATALKNSNMIEIAFWSPDPWFARDFVNRLTAEYVDVQARLQRESGAEDFFVTQSELLRQKLAESESALRAARERAGVVAGQQDQLRDRLSEFDTELARTRIARQEQERRLAFLEGPSGPSSARIATPELLALEGKRAELLGRYQPDSQRVREIEEQIRGLRTAISHYDSVIGTTQGETDVLAARTALAALKGKEDALTREREQAHHQAKELDAQSYELTRLERAAKLDEQAYLSYVRTTEESRLSNALQQSSMLRLSIIEPASVPLTPTSPRSDRVLALALGGGLAIALAVAFARDRLDPTLKTVSEVSRYGAVEVLAVLPER
jgi:uncharacterized protein involved in exopolysaccharide biosynthesis